MATTAMLARAPFNDLSGDIILRSGGDKAIDFYTHKFFLVHASPVFKDMFSLQQDGQSDSVNTSEGPPVIPMCETTEDLRTLLLWCNPGTIPATPISTMKWYHHYRLADKYLLDSVKTALRGSLITLFLQKTPVGVYMISRQLNWREEAMLAVTETLSYPLHHLVSERNTIPEEISARFLQDLLKYHARMSTTLSSLMSVDYWISEWHSNGGADQDDNRFQHFFVKGPKAKCCEVNRHEPDDPDADVPYTLVWWEEFVTECASSLVMIPNVAKVPLLELVCKANNRASKCHKCGPIASKRLIEFFNKAQYNDLQCPPVGPMPLPAL